MEVWSGVERTVNQGSGHIVETRHHGRAAACLRHDVPLVTFSSDLVSDISAQGPDVEHKFPRPLHLCRVCRESKVLAEQIVIGVLPTALVIRAAGCEFSVERIVASSGADVYRPGKRPLNSALAISRADIMPSLGAAIAAFAAHTDAARWQHGAPTCASS